MPPMHLDIPLPAHHLRRRAPHHPRSNRRRLTRTGYDTRVKTFCVHHLLLLATIALTALPAQPQETQAPLTFDVAAIRFSNPDQVNGSIKALPGGHGYTAQNIPVKLMISLMYKVPMRQIKGGPDWIDSLRFNVEARADHPYSLDDLHTMYQNLLAERFGLKFHRESKEGPVFALTVDPAGLKMKVNTSPQDFSIPVNGGPAHVVGRRVPMNYLCWWLGQMLQQDERPVIDLTGLNQNYDFDLSFMPVLPPGASADGLPTELRDLPSLFVAVREQLGLKLEPQKGPVEYLVIDHIDKPSDN